MPDEFESSLLKISRAEEHLKTFVAEWNVWNDGKPSAVSKRTSLDGRRHRVFVEVNSPPPVIRWSLIAGDCIHNLRSALDHLVYALAVRGTKLNPPPNERKLQFPITESLAEFEDKKRRYGLKDLDEKSLAFLEMVQPYNRADLQEASSLLILNDLDVIDKHRMLNMAFGLVGRGEITFHPGTPLPQIRWLLDPISESTEVARFTMDPPCLFVDYKIELELKIILKHLRSPNGSDISPLGPALELLITDVHRVIEAAKKR